MPWPALTFAGPAPTVLAVRAAGPGALVVDVGGPLAPGQHLAAELRHERLPRPLGVRLRARAAAQVAPGAWRATLEPVGTFDEVVAVRRALSDALGSRVLDGAEALGWLVPEAGGAWACHGLDTARVALLGRAGAQVVVRRRRDPDRYVATTTLADALVLAFDAEGTRPRCLPPSPLGAGLPEPPPPPPPPPPPAGRRPAAGAAGAGADEAEVLGAQTLVVRPRAPRVEAAVLAARALVGGAAPAAPGEAEVLGARTLIVRPGAPRPRAGAEDEVLAARTVVLGGPLRAQDIVPPELLAELDAALGDEG